MSSQHSHTPQAHIAAGDGCRMEKRLKSSSRPTKRATNAIARGSLYTLLRPCNNPRASGFSLFLHLSTRQVPRSTVSAWLLARRRYACRARANWSQGILWFARSAPDLAPNRARMSERDLDRQVIDREPSRIVLLQQERISLGSYASAARRAYPRLLPFQFAARANARRRPAIVSKMPSAGSSTPGFKRPLRLCDVRRALACTSVNHEKREV